MHRKSCKTCGTEFEGVGQMRYCRRECYPSNIPKVRTEVNCHTCGTAFLPIGRGRPGEYCSRKCREAERCAAKRLPPTRTCSQCGASFIRRGAQKLCSAECLSEHQKEVARQRNRERLGTAVTRQCDRCGADFQFDPVYHRGNRRFCSTRCREAAHERPLITKQCQRCGAEFITRKHVKAAKYCSMACRARPVTVSPDKRVQWQRLRKEAHRARVHATAARGTQYRKVFEADGWKCHLCGKAIPKGLPPGHRMGPTVDHLIPLSQGGTNDPSNLRAAHRGCNSSRGNRGGGEQFALFV